MRSIALSYRRKDTGAITGRLFDRLVARYGKGCIFRDIDNIPPGTDFRRHINDVLGRADILLVVIGSKWLASSRGRGSRLNDESDPVRVELEIALSRSIPVIPILVDNTKMPGSEALPISLKEFAFRNASRLDTLQDFDHDADRLFRHIDRILSQGGPGSEIGSREFSQTHSSGPIITDTQDNNSFGTAILGKRGLLLGLSIIIVLSMLVGTIIAILRFVSF